MLNGHDKDVKEDKKELLGSSSGKHNHPEQRPISYWRVVLAELRGPQRLWTTTLAAVIASLGCLLGGYTLGFASPALLQLNYNHVPTEYHLKDVTLALFAALALIGAMLGGAVAGWAIDAVGRKSALMFSAVLNLIGWLLLAGADSWRDPTGFKSLLLIGRFFTGAGLGWSMLCAPVYIGEVSTPVLRGLFGTLPMVSVSVGVLLVYLLGAIPGFSYQYISLVALAITAVFVLLVAPPWVPMTPRYLIMKGRWEEALRELKWLRGPNVKISEEAEDTKQVVVGTRRLTWRELFSELTKRKSIISLTLTIFAVAAQQLSGVDALIFFAGDLFNNVGFANPQLFASITIGVVSLLTTLASLVLVDLFGRKVLLISSGLTMAVSTFGLGAAFYITQHISGSDMKPLFIASAILFSVGFSVGWGSIPFILMSELLPLQTRGVLAGMVAIVNWGCGALVSGAYNWFAGLVQPYGAWWAFGILNLLSSVCVAVFLPETKGKKLEYIEDMLQNRYRLCVWR